MECVRVNNQRNEGAQSIVSQKFGCGERERKKGKEFLAGEFGSSLDEGSQSFAIQRMGVLVQGVECVVLSL
jgi:hypothetical protein